LTIFSFLILEKQMNVTSATKFLRRAALFAVTALSSLVAHANAIDDAIANMSPQITSEAIPIDPRYQWQLHPMVIMGAPRGDAIPSWWTGNRPEWCNRIISWFQVFEAQGNGATNSRVQVKNIRVYTLSESTRQWKLVDARQTPDVDLWQYPFTLSGSNSGKRYEATGGISLKPSYPYFNHGYGNAASISGSDVRAVAVSMDFRVIISDLSKPDDRAAARYVVNAGADYYPGNGQNWSLGYAPGVGQGRFLIATPDWRQASMLVPVARYGATLEEMRTNPPPLQ
jgi:hypothetical protein